MMKLNLFAMLLLTCALFSNAQGFLHADGKSIVDGNGNNFISRSIGTGNWMIQEGYMMKSTDAGINTQWQFREKLIQTIGETKTDSFYSVWLANHFTRRDVDSMKAWGFNSVRPALHYKWFTLPIEEEPVAGENTWLENGFVLLDSLVKWCADNQMYVILDMHGTPGGQGKNMDISDYNPSKPGLWESQENKNKLIALWKKIAERYKDEPYIGGYDLINETNWSFSEANNKPLWDIFKDITAAIREVDNNHMIILEGNGFANDYNGLPALWDDNLVLSFHKYWTYNDEGSLDWMINLRDQLNVPLWLGESGENSNTWFTNLISLAERKNIGWSWWPVKKGDINSILEVTVNQDYSNLIKFWGSGSPSMTEDQAFKAVLTWANNHKIENCFVHYDVIDAMIRQPHSKEAIPFKSHKIGSEIYFSDYDLGRNNIAYFDADTANYNSSTNTYTTWNEGWVYRNDGVDVQLCNDASPTNGYNVGWTNTGEWLQYTVNSDSVAAYTLTLRHASGGSGSKIHVEVNGIDISGTMQLPGTSDWQNWQTATFENLILPAGNLKIKFIFDQGGSNLSYFKFSNPRSIDNIDFVLVSAKTSTYGSEIYLNLNKTATTADTDINLSEFELMVDMIPVNILDASAQVSPSTVMVLKTDADIYSDMDLTLSYNGTSVMSGNQNLMPFSNITITNNLPESYAIPGRIQAEDFAVNNGLVLETCEDTDGGQSTGYSNAGDYLDYRVHVKKTGNYKVNYRVATERTNAELVFQVGDGDTFESLDTIKFSVTGGWQTWQTQSSFVSLNEGYYFIRLYVKQSEHNLNWFELKTASAIDGEKTTGNFSIFPNPANDNLTIDLSQSKSNSNNIKILDVNGRIVYNETSTDMVIQLKTSNFKSGVYFVKVENKSEIAIRKLIIN